MVRRHIEKGRSGGLTCWQKRGEHETVVWDVLRPSREEKGVPQTYETRQEMMDTNVKKERDTHHSFGNAM